MRRPLPLLVACLAALTALAGCGSPDETTPVACLEGPAAYLSALREAPGEVKVGGETPISDCLTPNQTGGDLATVGGSMLKAAIALNGEGRADPGGPANLRLGYLLGAARRGAEDTEGVHAELIRRLAAAARYSPDNRPLPPAFLRIYREGFAAGRAHG